MPDKKLTDNEIVKIFECCYTNKPCEECPLCELAHSEKLCFNGDVYAIPRMIIELINRLQAENERLRKENEILSENADTAFQDGLNENQALFEKTILKDFVKELKEKADELKQVRLDGRWAISQYDIDKLLKEKIGDNNA